MSSRSYMNSKNVIETQNRLSQSRGEILQQHIACEQLLTQIMTYYYGGKKQPYKSRVYKDLVSRITFNRKIQLVCKVLKEFNRDKEKVKEIRKELEYINKVRNHLAHNQWSIITEDEIQFGANEDKFVIDKNFAKKYKQRVIKIEEPLLDFFIKEMDPFGR